MKALFQRIFGHAESQRDGGAEMNTIHNAQCTMHNDGGRTGAMGRKAGRRPAIRRNWTHIAAVVAITAGMLFAGGGREARADWGDECYWKNNTSYTNWNAEAWYNSSHDPAWDNHNPNYEGGRKLIFDNDNKPDMGNNFNGDKGTNRWQIIFAAACTVTRTIRGTTVNHFFDNGGTMPKIENYSAVEQRIWFPISIGYASGMEVNPVNGDLSLTNVSAWGHALNVHGNGGHKVTINGIWYAGKGAGNTLASTLYVEDASEVYIKEMRAAGFTSSYSWKTQTINVNKTSGLVVVSNIYLGGNANFSKQGVGPMVIGGNSTQNSSTEIAGFNVSAGSLVFSNLVNVATRLTCTNISLTNNATIVMHSPAKVRRAYLGNGSTVEMDVFDNSTAAKLGVDENQTALSGDGNAMNISYSGQHTTLKLRLTSGFDPTQSGSFIVYEGRNSANCMQGESANITLQTVDLVGGRTLGTFALREGKNSKNSANNAAIWVDYTKPAVAPTVTTPTATSISGTGATLGAKVTDNGGAALTGGGVVYSSTASTPTVGGSGCTSAALASAPTVGTAFTKAVSSLTANTLYYYRGYAVNSAGTGYSPVGQFRTTASAPSAPTGLTVTQPATSDTGLHVSWTAGSGSAGTVVVMFTSDPTTAPTARTSYTGNAAYGSAASGLGGKIVYSGSGTSVDVTGLSAGTRYYVRAYAYKGTASETAALNSLAYSGAATANGYTLASQPTGAPTSLSVTARDQDSMTLSWTKGANSTYTLVIARQASAPSGDPVDGTEYDADAEYGDGDPLMSGYVVYSGNGTSVEVTGLTAGTRYYFWAYSFNGTGVSANYYTSSKAAVNNYTTVATPSPATGLSVTARGTTTLTMQWTRGAGTTYTLVAMRPDADLSAGPTDGTAPSDGGDAGRWTYGEGDALGGGRVVHNYNNTSGTATGLTPATHYYIAAHSRAGSSTGNTYAYGTAVKADAWTLSTAPASVGTISGTALGSSRAKLTWSKAGGESGVLVVVVTSGTPSPSGGTMYTGTGVYGPSGGGSALGNGFVVYRGTSAQTDYLVTGLSPSTSYTAYLFPYNVGSDDATVNYGPSRTATFTTTAATGPAVTASGVDANGMTMYWNAVGGASAYDVEASGVGTVNIPFSVNFSAWTDVTGNPKTGTVTKNGLTWTLNKMYPDSGNGRLYFFYTDGTDAWLELPPLNGVVTNITVSLRPVSVGARGIWLEFYEGGAWVQKAYFGMTWGRIDRDADKVKFVYAQPFIAKGQRVRLRNSSSDWTMNVYNVTVQGGNPAVGLKGRTLPVVGLSSGNAVTLSASQTGAGDYGNATVMAGVVPGDVDVAATWNSLAFTWDAPAVGTCVGYEVETTEDDAGWASDVVCEGSALNSSSYSASGWKYNGVTASGSSGSVRTAPAYNNGHCLVGAAGIGMESKAYDIAGATELELKYRVCAWNLSGATGSSEDAKTDVGRIEAYYKIDSGDWHFLGSARPSFTNDNYYTDVTNRLTEGMLNGRTVSFKLIAPNAEGNGGTYLRGAYIQALRIHKTAGLEGDYTSPEDTDVLEVGDEEFTISGLSANATRHFRVRALQGSDIDHITARSVWVEATGETTAFPGPKASVEGTGRYQVTATWPAYAGEDAGDYNITYKVQLTGCSSGAELAPVSECPASDLSWGSSTTDWTYQRAYSGSTASSYPKYGSPWHKLWGQYTTTTTQPAIESPEMNLTGYVKGYVEFSHNYFNRTNSSELALFYKLGDGAWTKWADVPHATTSASASATKRNVELPAAVMDQTRVKVKLSAVTAKNYTSGTNYLAQGPSVFGLKVTARGAGGGDYTCDFVTDEYETEIGETSFVFDAESLSGDSHLTELTAGSNYYVHVKTVLTPKGGGAATTSAWGEDGQGTTAAPQLPPEEVRAENVRQNHLTVAWDAVEGATASTLYKVQISSCKGTEWTVSGAQESSTTEDLSEVDDWVYVGGGASVTSGQETYFPTRRIYPAYAGGSEKSQVLAGDGEPGLESVAFSTVGATNVTLTFGSGRWYDSADTYADASKLTLMYSTDDGNSWTAWTTNGTLKGKEFAYNNVNSYEVPSEVLGHAKVKVRIVAEGAGFRTDDEPMGAAISAAKVTLKGAQGDYTTGGCLVDQAADLSYEQLSKVFGSLSPNTMYYFRVAASDGTQYGDWVNGAAKTLAVPATPDAPWAEDVGTHGFTMLWKAVDGADAYNVKVYTSGNENTPVFARDGVQGTSIQVTGLSPNTTYYMKVQSVGDGQTNGSWSSYGTQKTLDGVHVTGLHAENEGLTSLDVVWDADPSGRVTYTLDWGVADQSSEVVAETLACPNETLKRSDSSNAWFYVGGNNSQPSYYVGSAAADKGHALIYKAGDVAPGLQSRWFSTRGASAVEVTFDHGRFNAEANSAVTLSYSTDEGKTWTTAGTSPKSNNSVPTDPVTMRLPNAALGQKTVAVRLSAEDASGNKGAHVNNVKVKILSGQGTTRQSNVSVSGGRHTLNVNMASGTRYWFRITGTEDGESDTETASGATHEAPATYWKSQGFDGYDGSQALSYTTKFLNLSDGSVATGAGLPTVQVVDDENPLYGRKALRFGGSASANVYGVAEFDVGSVGGKSGVLTIPFAAKDLGANDCLYFCYSIDGGTTWQAPVTNVTTMGGAKMTRIGCGGSDLPNQNWPYNRGLNETTRPQGNAFVWEFPAEVSSAETLKFRLAFCGQSGGASHYYYVDNISLLANAGIPYPVSATAMEDGRVKLEWGAPEGQDVIIVSGKDQRFAPPSPLDLASLGSGYHVVMNGDSAIWPNGTTEAIDSQVAGGDRYYYYFYAVKDGQIGQTPASAWVIPKGMVMAIASQGFDGWDVHPWGYKKGRTTNPGQAGDCGYWAFHQGGDTLPYAWAHFIEGSWEYDGDARGAQGAPRFDSYYGAGCRYGPAGRTDPDCTNQLGVSSFTNYFGTNCFRFSGGSGWTWSGTHTWTNNSGNVRTETNPTINTNNSAIQFDTIDLSGYKNVQFSFHYAQTYSGGGNYMHVAISTNGNGANGTWKAYDNKGGNGWQEVYSTRDYGLQLQTMTENQTGGNVDFYDESRAPYGNPFVLNVPDSVTQITVRLTFFDTTGFDQRDALVFVDEVRLTGEVAMETPRPVVTEAGKTTATVEWDPITDASSYNIKVTTTEKTPLSVKMNEAFVVSNFVNGWTTNGNPTMTGGADHGGSGYGVVLDANDEGIISPEVGAGSKVRFWVKKSSGLNRKLVVYTKDTTDGTDDGEWVKLKEFAASALSTTYQQKEVDLPSRQYQKVKICLEKDTSIAANAAGNVNLDEIELLGGGDYTTTTTTYQQAGTSINLTGLPEGGRFWVSVQAYGTPAGVATYSGWGETAEYTQGTVYLRPDGFEMVRLWGSLGSASDVLIATSAGDDPIGSPEGGVTYAAGDTLVGGGTVLARWTTSYTENNNFEHVVPANAQVNYAVFWKRGAYYEGRYDTNFWMGKYGSLVAEAFAQTNGTDVGAATWSANGKGLGSSWTVLSTNIDWTCAEVVRNGASPFGLLATNQLYGAGGDMLALYPGDNSDMSKKRTVAVTRDLDASLASAFTKDNMWWGMFTMKMTWIGTSKWAGLQLLDASGNVLASIGKMWGTTDSLGIEGKKNGSTVSGTTIGGGSAFQIQGGHTYMIYFLWDNANGKMLVSAKEVTSTSNPVLNGNTGAPGTDGGIAPWSAEVYLDLGTVRKIRFAAESDVGQAVNDVWFDEFRMGPNWESLIKEPAPPYEVTSVHAIPDGKELVRLDWTYDSRSDANHPAAEGVLVLDKATAWTEEDIAAAKPVNGQPYSVGATIGGATVAYLGAAGWTASGKNYQDLVVEPGSTHYYRVYAHSAYMYTNGVAASGTAPSEYPVVMGTYLANENVDTFSYTNATTAGTAWKGGKGFENGDSDKYSWTEVTGTWTAMLPSTQPGYLSGMPTFGAIEGYPASAGNLVRLSNPGNNAGGSMKRELPKVITAADTNFYVAFRMGYQYEGANKWAGLSLLDSDGVEKGFVGKGSGSYWYTLCVEGGGNKSWGDDLRGFDGDASKTYLVILRYSFANNSLSAMTVEQGGQVPDYEPTTWPASIGVSIPGIKKLMLQAGGIGDGVTIGDVWFDELRWGTRWEDILSGVCADDITGAWWQKLDGSGDLTQTYLGNKGRFLVRSTPVGFGQEAWLKINWTGGASGHGITTNQLAWLKNEGNPATHTWWSNEVQVVETGFVGGPAATATWPAEASVTAMNADCVVVEETTRLEVLALGAPTGLSAAPDAVKSNSVINVSWTPWTGTLTGVDTTTKDVLIVRFSGTSSADALAKAADAANQPVQGHAYMAGDSIGEGDSHGVVVWRGGDGGTVTTTPAKGLMPETWYAFAVYTENYSYYSIAATISAQTKAGDHVIEIDGDPSDWYGEPPDTLNTAWVNLGEFIWKDKTGEERHSAGSGDTTVANTSSDIDEFRVYADRDWVYFLVKMTDITSSNLPYVAVGLDDRRSGSSTAMNWLGDESATEIGSNYWWTSEAAHYPRWQLNVHHVTDWGVQVEQYNHTDCTEWFAPQGKVEGKGWEAAITNGAGKAVEFRVARSDIGLDGMAEGATKVQRLTVASFKNTSVWNNQGGATAEIYGGTSKAVDSLAIAPQRPKSKPDNDYLLSSWDEDISDGKLDFWVDVTFDDKGIVENARPTPPSELSYPEQNAELKSSPTFQWKRGSDTDGRVTGYMLEVSTNADFNDLNGSVELRVNVAAADDPADTASTLYSYAWGGAHQQTRYYWRVRSRDNGGRLSVATNGVFWVKEDGDGPVAVLKYVGTDVAGYMAGNYAQLEKLYPEALLSVTDEEIEKVAADPNKRFGFVIEWTDPNGVYATNQIRKDASGPRVDTDTGYGQANYRVGDWAWNITSGDGRVSPNWDLVEFHTTYTDRSTQPPAGLVTDTTGKGSWTTNYWDEMGCWGYQWGYDDAFMVGAKNSTQDQTRGENGDSVITNLVRSAFDLHSFDTNVDYYLTVSAEDCTIWKESGSGWWDDGSWKSFKPGKDSGAPGKDYSSGYCKDGPNRARNVTTNQLLEILVRDNDVTAPGASSSLWNGNSLVVTTSGATGAPGATPADQLTLEVSEGLPVWTATDGDLVGRPLAFHFNVYDSSMTGIRTGTVATAVVTKGEGASARTTTMTNSSFMASLERKVDGSTQTVTWTNWANYDRSRSSLLASGEGMGEGTGAGTVLTWFWPALTGIADIEAFWPRDARGPDGQLLTVATNTIALSLWDLDNNRDGDQMGADTTLGYLKITDDDIDDPVLSSVNVTGTGIGAEAGTLGSWTLSSSGATAGTSTFTNMTADPMTGVVGTASSMEVKGVSWSGTYGGYSPNDSTAWTVGKQKGLQMTLTAPAGLSYVLSSVSFEAKYGGSHPERGPQNWGLYSSVDSYASPIATGMFDLTGEEDEGGTVTYAVSDWIGYAGGSTAAAASGTVTYRLLLWRTNETSSQAIPNVYFKNVMLTGVMTDSRFTTAVTDGDLANGTATYTLDTHDATSGILTSGKAYPTNVAEIADGGPEITFKHNGTNTVDAAKLTITSHDTSSGKVAQGPSDEEVRGTVAPASKKLINVNDAANGKSNPWRYQLSATVWDADTDRPGDTRTNLAQRASIPVYDDDYKEPVRGSGMQGGALGALLGNLTTFAPSVGSGASREYRINDRLLQQMITSNMSLYIGASFYDYSGWNRPTLNVTEGGEDASSVLSVVSGDGPVPAFSPAGTANDSSAAAYWALDKDAAMAALNASIEAGGFSATYSIKAASITDLDDDRQNASGANIDSKTAENVNLGSVTFLDNDTGASRVQGTNSMGQWRRTFVGVGAGTPTEGAWTDALLNTSLIAVTNVGFKTAEATNRVYDSQLAWNVSRENPLQIRVPTWDYSGGRTGQSAQGVQVGTTETTTVDGVVRTNSYLQIGGTKYWNWNSARSSGLADTKMAARFPTNVWVWESFTTNQVGSWLPEGENSHDWALQIGLYDADGDRAGDQVATNLNLGTFRVQDDDTTPPGPLSIDFAASTGISQGAQDRDRAAWTNSLTGVKVKFGVVEDGTPTAESGDLHASGVAGYRIGTTTPSSWAWGTGLENTTTNSGVVTAELGGAMTADDQGMMTRYVAAVDSDADRSGDQLVGTPDSFTVAFDITPPTVVNGLSASTDTVDDPTTQFALSWSSTDVGPDDPTHDNYRSSWTSGTGPRDRLSPWASYKIYYGTYDPEQQKTGDDVYNTFVDSKAYMAWSNVVTTSVVEDESAPKNAYAGLASAETKKVTLYDLDFDRDYVVVIVGVDKAGNEGPALNSSWATNNTIKFAVTQGVMRARADVDRAYHGIHNMKPTDKGAAALYWIAATNAGGQVTKEYDLFYRDATSFNESSNNTWTLVGTVTNNWFVDAGALEQSANKLRFYRASYKDRWQRTRTVGEEGSQEVITQRPLMSEDVYGMTAVPLLEGQNYVSLHGYGVGGGQTNTLGAIFGTDTNFWPVGGTAAQSVRLDVYSASFKAGGNARPSRQYYLGTKDGQTDWYLTGGGKYTDEIDQDIFKHGVAINLPEISNERRDLVVTNNGVTQNAIYWHPVLQVPTNNILPEADSTDSFTVHVKAGSPRAGVMWNLCSFVLPVACHPADLGLTIKSGSITNGFAPSTTKTLTATCDVIYAYDSVNKKLRDGSGMFLDKDLVWRSIYGDCPVVQPWIKPFYPNDMIIINTRSGGGDWTWTYSPTNFYNLPTRWGGW